MYVAITIIAFIVVLGVLVMVHELGHFLTARLFKVRVEEFGLGFPPRIYPRRSVAEKRKAEGRTVYSINALPLGGFVRLAGENGVTAPSAAEQSDSGTTREQRMGQSAGPVWESSRSGSAGPMWESSRSQSAGHTLSLSGPAVRADDPGAFASKPAWQRAIILAAGAFNNMVLAMLLVFVIFAGIGLPHTGAEVAGVALHSPAMQAGILPGDQIVSINGKSPQSLDDVRSFVADQHGNTITLQIKRGNALRTITMPLRNTAGLPCDQGQLGVVINPINEHYVPAGLGRSLGAALNVPGEVAGGMANAVGQVAGFSSAPREAVCPYPSSYLTFGGQIKNSLFVPSAPNAVKMDPCIAQLSASGSGLTGPIGIVRQIGCEANAVSAQGWVPLLTLVAEISADLAIVNLLPIPALDGGRLLFVLISVVARKRVRPEVEGMAHALGMCALLALILFVSWHDVSNWIGQRPVF